MASLPTFTGTVDQKFLIDRHGGSRNPLSLLDRFPDEIYSKAPDSHLVKLIYSLVGPAGVGWLLQEYLELRLQLDANGIDLFDLERFYGDPFKFGRILEELYDAPPDGLIDQAAWDEIRAKDESYRTRALDFFNGARAGNTVLGIQKAAKSGLNHNAQVIENYKYLFSLHTDEPYPTQPFGTNKLEEFIIVPQREISRSSVQTITLTPSATASGGTWTISFRGVRTTAIAYNALAQDIKPLLEALPTIGIGNVEVSGGPAHLFPIIVKFIGLLSNQPVPTLTTENTLTPAGSVAISTIQTIGGTEAKDEAVLIPAADKHHLRVAIDRIRPQHTIWSTYAGKGNRTRQPWNSATATSEYSEVIRYVTGNPAVTWPKPDTLSWIEANVEKAAPRAAGDLQYHYAGFHNLVDIAAYHEGALNDPNYLNDRAVLANYVSEHQGTYNQAHLRAVPLLADLEDPTDRNVASRAAADYPEPLTVTSRATDGTTINLINGIYPISYLQLPGVPQLTSNLTHVPHFWSSLERTSGDEFLEIDLGDSQMVNYVAFEITKKPVTIELSYDLLDQPPRRNWQTVTPSKGFAFTDGLSYTPEETVAWYHIEYHFEDAVGNIPMASFLRLHFSRKSNLTDPFLFDAVNNVQNPWSIEVRNLRVGRVIS